MIFNLKNTRVNYNGDFHFNRENSKLLFFLPRRIELRAFNLRRILAVAKTNDFIGFHGKQNAPHLRKVENLLVYVGTRNTPERYTCISVWVYGNYGTKRTGGASLFHEGIKRIVSCRFDAKL